MPINNQELVNVAVELSQSEDLKVSLVESGKGACIAGGGALVGGLLGGPPGLAIGGILGSVFGAWKGSGKYKPVVLVIRDMDSQQQARLATSLMKAFEDIQIEDAAKLLALLLRNDALKILVIQELAKFIKNETGLSIML
ncbi:hypothetical protein FQA39_LY07594 [Lamprigera yunnana]|nr:hypothetical protein FQA39_LY07594 [Lamprigera yunnana]